MSIIQAILLAIIEGLTEFLPVSSTGHMVIASTFMGIASDPFVKVFTVSIQLGGIMAVVVLYWKRFFQSWIFYFKIGVAFLPAVVFGLFLKKQVDQLLENIVVVASSLIAGGVLFLFLDSYFERRSRKNTSMEDVSYPRALKIGLFQVVAMVPGVSRSAATIIGGLTQGLSPTTAAEFSFFLAVPTMFAATAKSLIDYFAEEGGSLNSQEWLLLGVGNVVAFLVALAAIKALITYLTKHGFKVFGYYRIVLGVLILFLWAIGYFEGVELSNF
jgi:undecaprenyl-diphosphatase